MRSPCPVPSLSSLVRDATRARVAVVAVLVSSCGSPGVTTPMPEPLSLDPSLVSAPQEDFISAAYPSPTKFAGASRAAPPNALLRVTNLDTKDDVFATTTGADGSFSLNVLVDVGNELRFEAVVGGARKKPVDLRFGANRALTVVERPACVELDPGYDLALGASTGSGQLGIKNTCADTVTVGNSRSRLGLADFTLSTALPLTIAQNSRTPLSVTFTPTAPGPREDVLFVDITEHGTPVRYPFTLSGGTP